MPTNTPETKPQETAETASDVIAKWILENDSTLRKLLKI